jgi:hypothetical protein
VAFSDKAAGICAVADAIQAVSGPESENRFSGGGGRFLTQVILA